MSFVLPSRSEVGVLAPEIADEGIRVIHSDGETVSWSPPPAKPVMPDWSGIKSIRRYFNRLGYQVWPAWVYHKDQPARLLKSAEEGMALGIFYREATPDERMRYNLKATWDWSEGCPWRPQPWDGSLKVDLNQQGKSFVPTPPNPVVAQNALLEALIPTVTAAVVAGLKANGPPAPVGVNKKDWTDFLEFQAWKKTQEVVDAVMDDPVPTNALGASAISEADERSLWEDEAKARGVKVDGRWSLDRLKAEVEKAS